MDLLYAGLTGLLAGSVWASILGCAALTRGEGS